MSAPKKEPAAPAPKQFIAATGASIYGDVPSEVVEDPTRSMFDLPGYSEKRIAIDIARSKGEPITALTHRFHCVRHLGEQKRTAEFRANGYIPVDWDTAQGKYGVDVSMMPAAERAPDGTTLVGDLLLMVCDAEHAAAAAYRQEVNTNQDLSAAEARISAAAQRLGGTATVEDQDRDVAVKGKLEFDEVR